jgi:hypothetical protein
MSLSLMLRRRLAADSRLSPMRLPPPIASSAHQIFLPRRHCCYRFFGRLPFPDVDTPMPPAALRRQYFRAPFADRWPLAVFAIFAFAGYDTTPDAADAAAAVAATPGISHAFAGFSLC